ncbi:hypothetical protein [Sphingobacterium pedocola]|uniref:Beta-carotene 15,15'-monooxygenase n=1 Tax=Sphingobacterium pedocola TaxID=2082722 RepID=A0ABR9T832_9SPHI|nr:hypothetical protein [Sphingobacterium pedocola]MBE8721044.1 hypothetical protein [Sphingobacterium pedocola]
MLEFLKESTFKANDVIFRALDILKKHYFSIAGLCFILFVISQLAAYFPVYFLESNMIAKVALMLLTIILFFGLQLVLIKRAILLSQGVEHSSLMRYIPSTKQFVNFLFGLVLCSLLTGIMTLVSGIICFPLIYLGLDTDFVIFEIVPVLTGIIVTVLLLRITFFPFFILEKNLNFFRAVKLSVAFTKGNFFKIVTLFFFLALTSIISFVLLNLSYNMIALFFMAISIFLIVPLVSLAMAVAYTDMAEEYKGSDDPELFKNIL